MNPLLAAVRATVECLAIAVLLALGGVFYVLVHTLPGRYQELRERRS